MRWDQHPQVNITYIDITVHSGPENHKAQSSSLCPSGFLEPLKWLKGKERRKGIAELLEGERFLRGQQLLLSIGCIFRTEGERKKEQNPFLQMLNICSPQKGTLQGRGSPAQLWEGAPICLSSFRGRRQRDASRLGAWPFKTPALRKPDSGAGTKKKRAPSAPDIPIHCQMRSPRWQPVLMALLLMAKGEQGSANRLQGYGRHKPPPRARQEDAGAAASPRPLPAHFPPMYSEQVSLSLGRAGRRQPMCSRLCRSRTAAAWGRQIAWTTPRPIPAPHFG